jgi:DNA-binding SARP family transcriptional activator
VRLEVELLGRFHVRLDGREVPDGAWRHRRAVELVKLLALEPTHRVPAERVVDAFWPQLSPEAGAANLRKAAHLARRALGAPDAIVLRRGVVALCPSGEVMTDVGAFEAAAEKALRAADVEGCRRAAELYAGELLPEDRYEPWAEERREQLRLRYVEVLRSAELWQEVIEQEPLDEQAHRALMRAYAAAGNRHAALRQFRRLRDALAHDLRLQPQPETMTLYEEIARGPATTAPVPSSSPLVGRDGELRRALAVWRQAEAGRGRALLVTGEAGVGKTRFCEELLAEATNAGATTLRGTARAEEGSAPLAPFVEALDRLLLERPELMAGLTETAQAELARLTAAAPRPAPDGDGLETGKSQRIFSAVAQLIAAAARERGCVLLIEDLHCAGETATQLVHYLARVARFQPLMVLVSYRREEAPRAVGQMAASLVAQRLATEIRLRPLARDASLAIAERMAGARPSDEAAETIWRLGEGNPFYTEELAAAVRDDGSIEVPAELYDLVLARLGHLPRDVQRALARVAIFGVAFTADEFVAASGLSEEAAFACLDAALATGVIEEREAAYAFRHVLVPQALHRTLPSHRRRVVHRKAADWLAAKGADPARVAHHLLEAGSDREAASWLERAAHRAAALGALPDALRLVDEALARADDAARTSLLELRADVLLELDRPEAVATYAEALAAARGRQRTGLRVKLSRAYLARGDLDLAARALEPLEVRTDDERLALLLTQGYLAWRGGDADAAERAGRDARPLALRRGRLAELLQASHLLSLAALGRGGWPELIRQELEETSTLAPETADAVFGAHLCVAEYLLYGDQPPDQLTAFANDLRARAERIGASRGEAFATCILGEAELRAGRLDQAERDLSAAVELHRAVGSGAGEALSLQRLAEVKLAQGKPAEAETALDAALRLAETSPWRAHLLARTYATKLRVALHGPRALAALEEAETALEQGRACQACSIAFLAAAAVACAEAGELKRASAYLRQAETVSRKWEGGGWIAALREAGAFVRLTAGESGKAAALFEQAEGLFKQAGQPLDAERCRVSAFRLGSLSEGGTSAARPGTR